MAVILNSDVFPDREKTIVLTLLPFYHIYALMVMLGAGLRIGSKQVLLSRFEPNSFLKVIQDYKVWLSLLCLQSLWIFLVDNTFNLSITKVR